MWFRFYDKVPVLNMIGNLIIKKKSKYADFFNKIFDINFMASFGQIRIKRNMHTA